MEVPHKLRSWLVVIGGVLVHLTLGTLYCFGNMTPYITSYIRMRGGPEDLTYNVSIWIFAVNFVAIGLFIFIGGYIEKKLGPRWTTLIGCWIMSLGVVLTYFTIQVSFYVTLVTYGFLFGVGVGIAFGPPMACAIKWMPEKQGLANGLIVAGIGMGTFVFDQVQTRYINPENIIPVRLEGTGDSYFQDVALLERVPYSFLLLGFTYAGIQFCGCMLLSNPPQQQSDILQLVAEDGNSEDEPEQQHVQVTEPAVADVSPSAVVRTLPFHLLWWTFMFNGQTVIFVSSLYKAYGQGFIHDDHFLSLVGAFAATCNSAGRIMWGHLADRYSYRSCMLCVTCLVCALMSTLIATSYLPHNSTLIKAIFFTYICAIFGAFSGSFVLIPTAAARCFGTKHFTINFGLLFTSLMFTGPLGAILSSQIQADIGWFGMFILVACFSLVACILTCIFHVKRSNGRDV